MDLTPGIPASYSHLWLFFLLTVGIIALPGMDMAFVMANALATGRRAGLAAVGGLMAGGLLHTAMSAVGIGLIVSSYPSIYLLLMIGGALYMAWVGLGMARHPGALLAVTGQSRRPLLVIARRALTTCLLNPKAYLFNIAVTPQYMRPEYGSLIGQALIMALIVMATQGVIYASVAFAAGALQRRLQHSERLQHRMVRGVGALLTVAALWTMGHALVAG